MQATYRGHRLHIQGTAYIHNTANIYKSQSTHTGHRLHIQGTAYIYRTADKYRTQAMYTTQPTYIVCKKMFVSPKW